MWGLIGFILSLAFVAGVGYVVVDWVKHGQPW